MNDELREKAPRQDQELIGRAYELFDDFYAQTAELRMKWEENEELYRTNHWRAPGPEGRRTSARESGAVLYH